MNRKDADHIIELYDAIRSIDARLDHVNNSHAFDIVVWGSVSTGNYTVEIKVQGASDQAKTIRTALKTILMIDRDLRASGLRRYGFDVPSLPEASNA